MNQEDKSGISAESPLDLDDRYGRTRTNGQRSARLMLIALIIFLFAWFIWAATYHSDPSVKANLISFKAVNEKSMGIKFQVTRNDPNQALDCRLIAVDIDKYVVGEITYRVPAGQKNQIVETQIPTRSYSVSASVARCDLAR